ncbi:MAG: ribose-phosphate pyrophosphokinase [Clostridiales bacterium]|jgi:ribose-phosphate pyrophosphokinase|nr:ribose-phosphate pyrophosphokinase [Clostridiales bacterium]
MIHYNREVKIFTGNANVPLAKKIAERVGVQLGNAMVERFSDGEVNITIGETVRGCDAFLVQPTSSPANETLMELLIMIDAFKRASAERITAVMPYYGYARQDRKARARDPISAKLVADLLTMAGADRILTMDLHAPQIQGFFNIPVDHLIGMPLLYEYFREYVNNKDDVVIVSPDVGSVNRTRQFAERIDLPIAVVDKRRPKANVSEVMNIIGEVNNKKVIMVDDMIDTAGTLCHAAKALEEHGAKEVYAFATHGVLSGQAIERIENSPIRELIVLDTIAVPSAKLTGKIKQISCANLFADAIRRIHEGMSVSTMFK